jgi:Ca2+-binding RTX toxin-like protein
VLIGGAGADRLEGGKGDDIYVLSDTLDTLVESNNSGSDTVQLAADYSGSGFTLADRFENLSASGSTGFTLTGNDKDNRIEGNSGANTLSGLEGNDYLLGGGGNDSLTGGDGADVFAWKLADRGVAGAPAVDTITDFTYGTGFSTVEGAGGVAVGGGDVLDLRDLLQGEHTSSGITNPDRDSVSISNLTNYIHVETNAAGKTVLHISSQGAFNGTSNAGEDQTIALNVNLYSATGVPVGEDSNLLKMLIKMGTLRID